MRVEKRTPVAAIYEKAYYLYQIRILAILALISLYIFTKRWVGSEANLWPLLGVILIEIFVNRPYKFLFTDSVAGYRVLLWSVVIDFAAETTALHLLGEMDLFIYGICYFISIVYCALNIRASLSFAFATLASAIHIVLLVLEHFHVIPATVSFAGQAVTWSEQLSMTVRYIAFFYLLAIFVRFMGKALIQKEEKLEDLIRELKSTNEETKYAYHLQTDYFARMSHEIRAPLNSILGFSQLLLENATGPLSDKQRDFITRIERGSRHLRDMINDVLDLSKIESKKMSLTLRETNLVKVLGSVYDFFYEEACLKKIVYRFVEKPRQPLFVTCDELKIRQVLYNLLSNAMKFTPRGGRVSISLKKGTEGAVICVEDSGPGIDREFQKVIFTPYEQAGRTVTEETRGTGLGLAISKQFVDLHGGKIRVESDPGHGARFYVELPFKAKPPVENPMDEIGPQPRS